MSNDTLPKPDAWVMHVPVLSTGHLSEAVFAALMETRPSFQYQWASSNNVMRWIHGCMVWIEDDDSVVWALPESLRACMQWAKDAGYSDWLRFDPDGDVIPGLATYDW